jgi:hypothetical protein
VEMTNSSIYWLLLNSYKNRKILFCLFNLCAKVLNRSKRLVSLITPPPSRNSSARKFCELKFYGQNEFSFCSRIIHSASVMSS